MDLLFLVAISFIFLGVPLALGFALLSFFRFPASDSLEHRLAHAFALGIIALALLQFLNFLTAGGGALFNALAYTLGLGIMLTFGFARRRKNPTITLSPFLWGFLCFFGFGLSVLCLTPRYTTAYMGDWKLYFPNVLFFQHHAAPQYFQTLIGREYLLKRTPLLPWFSAFLLSPIASPFYLVQISALLANALLFFAGFTFCEHAFERKTARLFLLLLPLSTFLMRDLTEPIPKTLCAAFLLLSYVHYDALRSAKKSSASERWNQFLAAIFGCAAYLSHPSALLYLIGLGIDAALRSRKQKRRVLSLRIWFLVAAIMILPWILWIAAREGWREPFVPSVHAQPEQLAGSSGYWASRLQILATTLFFPQPLWALLRTQGMPASFHSLVFDWSDALARFFWETALGALGLGGIVTLLWTALRSQIKIHVPDAARRFVRPLFIGAGLCLAVHMIPDLKGLWANVFLPVAIFQIAFVAFFLSHLPRLATTIALILYALESAFLLGILYVRKHGSIAPGFDYLYDETVRLHPSVLWFVAPFAWYAAYAFFVSRQKNS